MTADVFCEKCRKTTPHVIKDDLDFKGCLYCGTQNKEFLQRFRENEGKTLPPTPEIFGRYRG